MKMTDYILWTSVAVVAVFVLVSLARRRYNRSVQQAYESSREKRATFEDHLNTIFVSIPCYKDEEECAKTLFSLFDRADCPWRVSAGVLHHVNNNHIPSLFEASSDTRAITDNILNRYEHLCRQSDATSFSSNIRIIVRPASEAQGPFVARAEIEHSLFRKERFFMTVDSHTRFVKSWDTKVLDMYRKCFKISEKPILTTYPGSFDRNTSLPDFETSTFVAVDGQLDDTGFPRVKPIPFELKPVRCFSSPFWIPCFSFASSNLIKEVPMDPGYSFVFWPEMYVQSARYYTHGWDFLHPQEPICHHLDSNDYRPLFLEQLEDDKSKHVQRAKGTARALALFRKDQCSVCVNRRDEHTPSHGLGHLFESYYPDAVDVHRHYGLGKERTLADFVRHCGVALFEHITDNIRVGCCGTVQEEELLAKYGRVDVYNLLLEKCAHE